MRSSTGYNFNKYWVAPILLITKVSTDRSCTPYRSAKGVIKRVIHDLIHDVIVVTVGLAGFVRALPHSLKISMAPKMARNSGDKTDGAKILRSGKDKGDPAGVNRRPISTMGGQTGKNITRQRKDVKVDDNITPLPENRGKSKTQATITSFLAGGTQESGTTLITPTSGEGQTATESSPVGALSEKTLKETAAQPGGGGLVGSDSCATVRRKEKDPPISQEWPPAQQHATTMQGEDLSNIKPTRDIVAVQNISQSPEERDMENEKEMKILDWAKDSGDKFYSLTEESDFSSADEHSPSESGSSISSERGNASSSDEPTVRQRRRQHNCIKTRSGSQEGTEFSTSSGSKTLKWDYSSISLMDITRTTDISAMGGQQLVDNDMEGNNGGMKSATCAASTDSGMLQSIFNSIKEFQTETLIESRRASVATKRLQGAVRKVAKSCTEIEAKLGTMDERIVAVEEDVDMLKQQNAAQEGQLTDIMWKLEDFENRQRRNNLSFLGLEGNDIRAYMTGGISRIEPLGLG
ncbi:hypothetical protein NDU88_006988 [Pleurodeles waltl]|uniref:Uncharacterized protein n=1 Tax=Pleurodeles waltl TaxID=8319 RepID=A0AAV7VNG1_PLEWA|nr:hypothetical protein NDU88_006988 [Pleurodeles waltl]